MLIVINLTRCVYIARFETLAKPSFKTLALPRNEQLVMPTDGAKLFGPPTGGILRDVNGSYKCWAQRDNDYELTGATLRDVGAPSEWTPGSGPDRIMLDKAWDVAPRWRSLNLLPMFGFLRACMPEEVIKSMDGLDYLTHRSNPYIDLVKLDQRYYQHLVEDEFEFPCMPWLQYKDDGDDEASSPTSNEKCEATSCDACVPTNGCGWCTDAEGHGKCVPVSGDDSRNAACLIWDVHQCLPQVLGDFGCGPCTGGTEVVMNMASIMAQIGLRSAFISKSAACSQQLLNCKYDVPYFKVYEMKAIEASKPAHGSVIWTCLGCPDSANLKTTLLGNIQSRHYQVILGYHTGFDYNMLKLPTSMRIGFLHNYFNQVLDTGEKKWTSGIGKYWYDNQLPLDKLEPMKKNIVVTDEDFPVDWDCVRQNAVDPTGKRIEFDVNVLQGMTRQQWHALAQTAKVMVDLNMPGYEFGNLEAVLNGAVHIGSAHTVGTSYRDYLFPNTGKIFLAPNACAVLGKKIGGILHNWPLEVNKQNGLRSLIARFRNEQWLSMVHFFQDDVSIVLNAATLESYRMSYSIAFAGALLYPHARFQLTQNVPKATTDFDWYSAFSLVTPANLDFSRVTWAEPANIGDHGLLLGPIENIRLYVAFLPTGFLPLSKSIFGYLATELERRKHRHWVLCPETGLVFARQWWYRANQPKLVQVQAQQNLGGLTRSKFVTSLFQLSFGTEELKAASLDKGKIRSMGMYLPQDTMTDEIVDAITGKEPSGM